MKVFTVNLSLLMTLILISFSVEALTLKVGVLAPEGTSWTKALKKLNNDIKKKTAGRVKFKFYFGGAQGDEPDVLRKIRVGQLHGGIFTGKTLGDISGDVRVIELPFNFLGKEKKAWKTVETMTPFFNKGFEKNEFQNLGFFEIGQVYFIANKKTSSLEALKGVKIWSWEGDRLVDAIVESLNLIAVPLPLPDVLSSLSTGIIEAAYSPPMAMIALQWHTKVKYLIDLPLSYSIGAFLVSKKIWSTIKAEDQKNIESLTVKYFANINSANEKGNIEGLEALKGLGIEFLQFPKKDMEQAQKVRSAVTQKLKGKLFSGEAYRLLEKSLQ